MVNKMTTVSQDVVINLKARSSEIENSVKSLMQKLQGTNLSDSFTKSYLSSLQKVLDKNYELKKIISDTNSVNSKTTSNWSDSYNKLATELTKIIAKIEGHPVDFNDLISFDSAQYKQLKKVLDDLSLAQKNVYNKTNIQKKLSDISSKTTAPKSQGKIKSAVEIGNEQEIYNLIHKETVEIQNGVDAQQKKLSILKEQVNAAEQLKNLIGKDGKIDFTGLDTSTKQGQAAFSYAKQQIPSLSPNATAQELSNAWTSKNTKALIKPENISSKQDEITEMEKAIGAANTRMSQLLAYRNEVIAFVQQLATDFQALTQPIASADAALKQFEQAEINAARIDLDKISTDADEIKTSIQGAQKTTEDYTESLVQLETRQTFFSDLQSKITQIFGLANAFQGLRRFVQESWAAIKELDAAFTEIAVVTDETTGDLWKSFDAYNNMAQQLGVTTTDAIETSALYYQQGLDTADVMTLTTETIKMARIAGMEFADATQAMTSAIRGFKLEMSDAQSVTDVYSALAAEAAVDTDQLATAISKTASIAGNAGLSLEDTSAFLTQIIETTQEAPETAGTALKTIIARFTELKKDPAVLKVDVEGEEVSANKIEEALRTADVALRDTEGNFRDLDEVFLELSSKWNSLDRNTQRYIATTAAGSRQQSRFIAMMDDYERTMELVGIANDSAGAGAIQFAKTLDSVSARVNKLKSNFEALIGNLIENETVKGILDVLNEGMKILVDASEKGVVAFGALIFIVGKAIKSSLSLIISQFANAEKKNEDLRAKIGKIIKTTVLYQPDLTLVNEANAKLKADPITVGQSPSQSNNLDIDKKRLNVQEKYIESYNDAIAKEKKYQDLLKKQAAYIAPKNASNSSQNFTQNIYTQNAKIAADLAKTIANKDAWKALTPVLTSTVSSGVAQGIATGVISGDWKVGLATGIISTFSSALSNPAITSAIGGMFTKSGGTVATALGSIGGALTKAVPYVFIAAGVAAVGYAFWNWIDPIQSANRELKKAQDNLDKVNNDLEKSRANFLSSIETSKSIATDIATYKKLTAQTSMTAAEQEDYNKVVSELAQQFPQLIVGYDSLGNAVIDQKVNWEKILELQKESIALSQSAYASDVMASAQGDEDVRLSSIEVAKEDVKKAKKRMDASRKVVETFEDDETLMDNTDAYNSALKDLKKTTDAYEIAQGKLTSLQQQSILTAQRINNAYLQIASSFISAYNAVQVVEGKKVNNDISPFIQEGVANEIKTNATTKDLDWDTTDEEEKKENLSKARLVANNFIEAVQSQINSSSIDISTLAEKMANMTQQEFIDYLKDYNITEDSNGELYTTLMVKFVSSGAADYSALFAKDNTSKDIVYNVEQKGGNINDLVSAILTGEEEGKQYLIDLGFDKNSAATMVAQIQTYLAKNSFTIDIVGLINYNKMADQYGAEGAGKGVQYLKDTNANDSLIDIISSGDVSNVSSAQEMLVRIVNETGMSYETATQYVLNYAAAVGKGSIVNKQSISNFSALNSALNKTKNIDKYTDTVKNLKGNILDLDDEGINALIEDVPAAADILRDLASGAIDGAEASDLLSEAIMSQDIKNSQKNIQAVFDAYSTGGEEYAKALNDAGLTAKQFENNQLILQDIINGNTTALWNYFYSAQAIANANYNGVGVLGEQLADNQIALAGANQQLLDYATILQTLGLATIETVTVSVATPREINGKTYFEYHPQQIQVLQYKEDSSGSPFSFKPYIGGSMGSNGGGDDYETKTDKYYNEINAIERLNTQLEKLADLREKGNLSPEEYRSNLDQTAKYYQELQNQLHNYNESLRKDQATLITEIAELNASDAISVKNGVLIANKDAISKLSSTTQEKIDGMIDDWEKLTKTLEENSDAWWEAKYALEELADKYLDSFTSVEDKIRDVLIKQDQDKIDDRTKMYDKLKEADNDYLEALKDNIDKRRKARDKETDYNDLAKKEKRLALLKRDTSGVYGAEILSLEEEIAQTRQDLSDKEVDDMVDSLEEQATKRADAYDKELKELQDSQEDKEKSMIEYNKEVDKIMQSGAENILKWLQTYDEEYTTASETAQKKYLEGWRDTINEANSYVNNVANGTVTTTQDAVAKKAQVAYAELSTISTTGLENPSNPTYAGAASDLQESNAEEALKWYNSYIKSRKGVDERAKQLIQQIIRYKFIYETGNVPQNLGFSQGGLVDYTGPATVHGTPTKPEAFLSAADTKNFQILMELLNKAVNYKGDTQSDVPNALQIGECQIIVEVGSIADDYDVDQAIDKVKQSIVDNSNYRNVNIVTRKK